MLALTGVAGAPFAQDVIAARREGLKAMAAHLEAIKAVAEARGDAAPLVPRIDEMIAFFEGLPARFPEGSGTGNTRALPSIWTDRAGFERAHANMVAQLRALRSAAQAGDPAAFTAAFQQTGATCGACHRAYRAPAR
jgi:cytochrome c556